MPKNYKYNAISTLAYRATKLCSTYRALHEEFYFIRALSMKNGYPVAFVESVIRRQLNLLYTPPEVTPPTVEKETVVLRIPYYGTTSEIYGRHVTSAVSKQYPLKKIRLVCDVTAQIGLNFNTKDRIANELKSGVVYEATCSQCNTKYIGKTCHHLRTRIHEHLLHQIKLLMPSIQPKLKKVHTASESLTNEKSDFHMTTCERLVVGVSKASSQRG